MDDVTVLVFGPLRERVGAAEVHVAGATVQEVWDELVRRHPAAAVDASRANGLALQVSSTPTIFINGRRIVGADPHLVEQNIKYELAQQKTAKH